jgi:DNA-binding NtrC family response regulator
MPDHGRRDLVFVVDDEPVIAETAALVLCSSGFDARAFTDPLAALKAAQIDPPNLLLSDVLMPGLNGFQLSTGIIQHCPQCKVILFSGNPDAKDRFAITPTEKSLDILSKPVLPGDLITAIQHKLQPN